MNPISGYSIMLPPPWRRLSAGAGMEADVEAFVDRSAARVAGQVPPDQLGPAKRTMREQLVRQLAQAREGGVLDYYLPETDLAGVSLNASFTVSTVIPDANADAAQVAPVLAELTAAGSEPVDVGDTVWARTESVVISERSELAEGGLPAVKIDYTTAVPGDERRWVLVTCTVVGDGEPESDHTRLVVELFDAMMTTWRWAHDAEQ